MRWRRRELLAAGIGFLGHTASAQIVQFSGASVAAPFSPASLAAVKYFLDARTINAISDGANITTASWVDQSISAHGALATATAAVYRATGGPLSLPCVEFNGSTSLCVSPAFSAGTQPRIFVIAKAVNYASQKYMIDGLSLNQIPLIYIGYKGGGTPGVGVDFSSTASFGPVENGHWSLHDLTFTGSTATLQVDGQLIKSGSSSAGTHTGLTIGAPGNQLAGFFANMQIAAVLVCDSTALTGPQATQIRNWAFSTFGIVTRKLVICDGDSLTQGQGASAGNDYPSQMVPLLTGGATVWDKFNNGVGGAIVSGMETTAEAFTDPYLGAVARSVIIAWCGTNDIQAGTDAATIASSLVTFCNNRISNGADKIILSTIIPRGTFSGAQETVRQTLNATLLAEVSPPWNTIVDLGSVSQFSNPANPTYFQGDEIHLTDAGYAIAASNFASAVNALG